MNINQLPDLCLIHIFDRLPVVDLLQVDQVCERWAQVQPAACLHRKSLSICDSRLANFWLDQLEFYEFPSKFDLIYQFYPEVKDDSHPVSRLFVPSESSIELKEKFPKVTSLSIAFCSRSAQIDEFIRELLDNWRDQLTNLKLFGVMNWPALESSLNELPSLKFLSIWTNFTRVSSLGVFPQLEQFYCNYSVKDAESLVAFGELIQQKVNKCGFHLQKYENLENFPADKINRLSIRLTQLDQLTFICKHWKNLDYLHLQFAIGESSQLERPFDEILYRLNQLSKLTELKLDIVNQFNQTYSIDFEKEFATRGKIPKIPWIKPVKNVTFLLNLNPHKLHLLEVIFPSADNLSFRVMSSDKISELLCSNDRCQNCGHIQAICSEYDRHLVGAGGGDQSQKMRSWIVDFYFKYGKICYHHVKFG